MEKQKQVRRGDRTERIEIRVTPAEKEQLTNAAAALGLSVTAFLVSMALGDKIGQMMLDGWSKQK